MLRERSVSRLVLFNEKLDANIDVKIAMLPNKNRFINDHFKHTSASVGFMCAVDLCA